MAAEKNRKRGNTARIILTTWLVNSAAILIAARILPGVECDSIRIALITGLVLSLLTFLIEPVLYLLTLPINMATFGLFTFVLNGIVLYITSRIVSDFKFTGTFWRQLVMAVLAAMFVGLFRTITRAILIKLNWIQPRDKR